MTPLNILGVIVIVTVAVVTSSGIFVSADLPPDARPCYDYLCRCSEDGAIGSSIANCSNNGNKLTFIPKLMSWVKDVNLFFFSYNQLTSVTNETVRNISHYHITYLRLRSNNIQHIASHAFDKLKYLATLDLSDNLVSLPKLNVTFHHMPNTLAYVYLDGLNIHDSDIEGSLLKGLERNSVTGIHLARNHLTTFNFNFFTGFSELATVSVEENNISTVFVSGYKSTTLSTLWLEHNNIRNIPDFCYEAEHSTPSFPSLYTLNMEFNEIQVIDALSVRCLKNLRHLYLSGNPIGEIQTRTFEKLENLQLLNISQNTADLRIDAYAFNISQLKMLNLSNSRIKYFIDEALPKQNCNLQTIDLSGNNIFSKWNPEFSVLLTACHNTVRNFYCNNCSLTGIPAVISSFRYLEGLFLNYNNIKTIRKHMFHHNHGLRKLYLSNNNISTVQDDAISNSVRSALTHASLEYNPFVCSCDILWLRNWLVRAKSLFSERLAHYNCRYPGRIKSERIVDDPYIKDTECHDNHRLYQALCTVGTVFLCLMCFALGYKFRWNIRYRLKWKNRSSSNAGELQPLLTNDVYILYSDDDYAWVRHNAVPNLEEKGRLKVCFRQRDFNPKVHMVDSIATNLQHSRKVLFVLSNSFFKDSASQFELSLVQKHLEDIHVALVVVLLEDIDNRYMSHDLYRLMKDREHVKWTGTEDNADMVWRSLLCQIKGMTEQI